MASYKLLVHPETCTTNTQINENVISQKNLKHQEITEQSLSKLL